MSKAGKKKVKIAHHTMDAGDVIAAEKKHLQLSEKQTVSGLAISGGGIRSASFGLGVLQALVNNNQLSKIDYMSTVSGGGYLGSALTWALHLNKEAGTSPHNFPLGKRVIQQDKNESDQNKSSKQDENYLLDFIRQHGSYLTPTSNLDMFSFIAVVIRSMIMSLFVYISFLTILMTFLLYVIYQISHLPWIEKIVIGIVGKENANYHQGFLIVVGLFILIAMAVMGFIYSINTFSSGRKASESRYLRFVKGQMTIGWMLKISLTAIVFGTLPYTTQLLNRLFSAGFAAGISTIFGAVVGNWQYIKARKNEKNTGGPSDILIYTGAFALFYGVILLSYIFATTFFLNDHFLLQQIFGFSIPFWFLVLVVASLLFGYFVNLNFIGPHYMWRSRLMEAFMPNPDAAKANRWEPAKKADSGLMENMCDAKNNPRPYHIINTNIILSNSQQIKYSGRGGDNCIISPLYCGSAATGWKETKFFQKKKAVRGITLASAMATSAAALNPNAGVSGGGVTRNVVVSILLSMLNLRLGYWTSNPGSKNRFGLSAPNFFSPGLTSEIFRLGLTEEDNNLLLSDGGHFENLGIYELIRRELDLIIVLDGGADPDFNFDDLANAIEKVRVDFGARINWKDGFMPDDILPGTSGDSFFQKKYNISKRGFAVAEILYKDKPKEKAGTLVYLKLAMIGELPTDVYSYKGINPSFPHQSTADQFFDEKQFEAYRELGYYVGWQMMKSVEDDKGDKIFPILEEQASLSRFHSRNMTMRINGKLAKERIAYYPVDLNDVGVQVADELSQLYDRDYFSDDEKDNFPLTGTVEVEIEDLIYKFSYDSKNYPDTPGTKDFYVTSNRNEKDIWHSSTNPKKKKK